MRTRAVSSLVILSLQKACQVANTYSFLAYFSYELVLFFKRREIKATEREGVKTYLVYIRQWLAGHLVCCAVKFDIQSGQIRCQFMWPTDLLTSV